MAEELSWSKLWLSFWPRSPHLDPELWAQELRHFFDRQPPDNAEMRDAVRWVSQQNYRHLPGLKELRIALCTLRKERRAVRYGYAKGDPAAFIGDCKAAMLKAGDHEERLEILCHPDRYGMPREGTIDEMTILDCWARSRWGQSWLEYREQLADEFSELLAKVCPQFDMRLKLGEH